MAIGIYSAEELAKIATLPVKFLSRKLANMNVREVLLLRRNLQISLAAYSTKKKVERRYKPRLDNAEAGIIFVCRQIEMRAREAYFKHCFKRSWPDAQTKGVTKLAFKQILNAKWEKILSQTGY